MSGETVFHPEDMIFLEANIKDPKHRTGFDRNFWIWEEHDPKFTYLLSADVARGDGNDHSAFHIFKIETMEIVADYQGKATPDIFSNLIDSAGREYGECMIAVENNSVGFAVLEKLRDKGYPNIYYSYKSSHEYVDPITAEYSSGTVAGFSTTQKTRPLIVAKMEEFIRNKLIKIYSSRLFNEMKTFVWHNGRPQAMKKYNDDLIMSCAIGCWVKDIAFTVNQRDLQYKKAFLNSMTKSDNILSTAIKGMEGYKTNSTKELEKKKKKQDKYIWLLKG